MSDEIDLSGVPANDVAAVLARAIALLDEYGWTPNRGPMHEVDGKKRPAGRISVLQAITLACDEIGGRGVDSAELHMAAVDAVCISATGKPAGTGASVSRWERGVAEAAAAKAITECQPEIIAILRPKFGYDS